MNTDVSTSDLAARISDPTDPTRLVVTVAFPDDMGATLAGANVWVLEGTGSRPILDVITGDRGQSLTVEGEDFDDAVDRMVAMVADRVGVSVDDVVCLGTPPPPE